MEEIRAERKVHILLHFMQRGMKITGKKRNKANCVQEFHSVFLLFDLDMIAFLQLNHIFLFTTVALVIALIPPCKFLKDW